jgi:hypothetical protein
LAAEFAFDNNPLAFVIRDRARSRGVFTDLERQLVLAYYVQRRPVPWICCEFTAESGFVAGEAIHNAKLRDFGFVGSEVINDTKESRLELSSAAYHIKLADVVSDGSSLKTPAAATASVVGPAGVPADGKASISSPKGGASATEAAPSIGSDHETRPLSWLLAACAASPGSGALSASSAVGVPLRVLPFPLTDTGVCPTAAPGAQTMDKAAVEMECHRLWITSRQFGDLDPLDTHVSPRVTPRTPGSTHSSSNHGSISNHGATATKGVRLTSPIKRLPPRAASFPNADV